VLVKIDYVCFDKSLRAKLFAVRVEGNEDTLRDLAKAADVLRDMDGEHDPMISISTTRFTRNELKKPFQALNEVEDDIGPQFAGICDGTLKLFPVKAASVDAMVFDCPVHDSNVTEHLLKFFAQVAEPLVVAE
jgi:hypothetical protein